MSLLRLNQRLHKSHEPPSSFLLRLLCSTCCEPELMVLSAPPPPLGVGLSVCTSDDSAQKSPPSSPTQLAWRLASPPLPPKSDSHHPSGNAASLLAGSGVGAGMDSIAKAPDTSPPRSGAPISRNC